MKLFTRCNSNVISLQMQFTIHCQTLQKTAWQVKSLFHSKMRPVTELVPVYIPICSSNWIYWIQIPKCYHFDFARGPSLFRCDLMQKYCFTFLCPISSLNDGVVHGGNGGNNEFSFQLVLASLASIEASMWKVVTVRKMFMLVIMRYFKIVFTLTSFSFVLHTGVTS